MSLEDPSANVILILLVLVTVLHASAVVTTCLRLWIRVRLHRFWWEDVWAALALCLDISFAVSIWTFLLQQRYHPWYISQQSYIVSVWLTSLLYPSLIWAIRTSILFSLIRVLPPSCRMRRIACGFAILFFLFWALRTAARAYTCGTDRSWYDRPGVHCPIGLLVAVIDSTTAIFSGVVLVALPGWILWQWKLMRDERILVLSIFAMNLVNAIGGVIHVTFLITTPGLVVAVTANFETALDLLFCNLLVLVTSLHRSFRNREDMDTDDPDLTMKSQGSLRTSMDTLTTIDLERLDTMSIQSTQSAPATRSADTPIRSNSLRSCLNLADEHESQRWPPTLSLEEGVV